MAMQGARGTLVPITFLVLMPFIMPNTDDVKNVINRYIDIFSIWTAGIEKPNSNISPKPIAFLFMSNIIDKRSITNAPINHFV